ncbi:MAG: hypothetical protein CO098_15620 [Bacteroidetes bacterium CG_4_9_14_3_um_filter_41_19]|nr:MAG: hypothetical protein CO098_15620 [Bacteroidetes bacterium CG_4_9_14_3_um_filter_41_19]
MIQGLWGCPMGQPQSPWQRSKNGVISVGFNNPTLMTNKDLNHWIMYHEINRLSRLGRSWLKGISQKIEQTPGFISLIHTCQPHGLDSPKRSAPRLFTAAPLGGLALAYTTTLIDLLSSYLQHSTILLPWLILGTLCFVADFRRQIFLSTAIYISCLRPAYRTYYLVN